MVREMRILIEGSVGWRWRGWLFRRTGALAVTSVAAWGMLTAEWPSGGQNKAGTGAGEWISSGREISAARDSYTEGLFYLDGLFYEGTGMKGRSGILVVQPETGKVMQRVMLAPEYFGEGVVDWGPDLYEWTWESHVLFVYDRFSLRPLKQLHYTGEGWGMTHDARNIITSDGTDVLRFRDR